ncbi:inner-membrane translocator (plasmid) [Rhizobium leguminosarum bv. trifolii WSM2304]|uniref:Inner-membrane translocator n=1 Tax=Rhizobium leguminosarum bv. trifolii (strain WSM2304) TaxID=395492 RepID=A0ABF7QZ53_RHILW|nr:ABC transporter permease [Rhizobium leguminosarum]ACI59624.1 inner-membrane translocator [Rhizobium leguminosarum bv. trifolii WSM2304]
MIFNMFTVGATVQAITPILLAALAASLCGRVGIFNIALEGQMLLGAFMAVVGSYFTGSAFLGVLIAMLSVVMFTSILAFGSTVFRGDSVIIGISMNLLAAGLTAYLLRQIFHVSGAFSDPGIVTLRKLRIPGIEHIPVIGWVLSRQTAITYLSWLLVAAVTFFLFRTATGLRLRGVGIDASAAESVGVRPDRYQISTVLFSGVLTGLAGAQLSLGTVGLFAEDMTAGRGWIAVVAVMLGRDHPLLSAIACVVFGVADAVSVQLQARGLPSQVSDAVPYVVTLLALAATSLRRTKRNRTRAALG